MLNFCASPFCGEPIDAGQLNCSCGATRPHEGWDELYELGDTYDNRFQVLKPIYLSDACVVYKAIDTHEDGLVALKVMTWEGAGRSRDPADHAVYRKLCRSPIPGVVRFVASRRWRDAAGRRRSFVVTEYQQEGDASKNPGVFAGKPLETLERMLQVLVEVHARGFLVRDGKPANWLLSRKDIENLILGDMGGTKDLRRNAGSDTELADDQTVVATDLTRDGMAPHTRRIVDRRRERVDSCHRSGSRETDTVELWHTVLDLVFDCESRDPDTGEYCLDGPLPTHIADETPTGRALRAIHDHLRFDDPGPAGLLELVQRCQAWVARQAGDGDNDETPWQALDHSRRVLRRGPAWLALAALPFGLLLTLAYWGGMGFVLMQVVAGGGAPDYATSITLTELEQSQEAALPELPPDGVLYATSEPRGRVEPMSSPVHAPNLDVAALQAELRGPPERRSVDTWELGAKVLASELGWEDSP